MKRISILVLLAFCVLMTKFAAASNTGFRWGMVLARREYDDNTERVFLKVTKANYSKRSGVLKFDPDKNHSGILKFSGATIENSDFDRSSAIALQTSFEENDSSSPVRAPRFNAIDGLD